MELRGFAILTEDGPRIITKNQKLTLLASETYFRREELVIGGF
jgi:hypothetical protein